MDPQTQGKHIVLRAYLNAWLPIMGFHNERIVFVDGFAGPGEYTDGEDGSPIIALKAMSEHIAKGSIKAETIFVFIEFEAARVDHLRAKVELLKPLLPRSHVLIEQGDCNQTLNSILDDLEQRGRALAPAFVMLDPFGVSHTPLSLIKRLLGNPKSEIYVSFMWEWINRFKETGEFELPLDELFGTPEWRRAAELQTTEGAKQYLYGLYARQLRTAGAKHVTYFELFNENRHVYTIFFATKHPLGMDRMKQAIWKADTSGSYQFRGRSTSDGQGVLEFPASLEQPAFERQIRETFGGQGAVSVDTIEAWSKTDATDFHSGHLRTALKRLERDGYLVADERTRKKKGSYPAGTLVTIMSLAR